MSSYQVALQQEQRFDLDKHTILMGYMGSTSHGTHIPPEEKTGIDDKDVMGIAIPPSEYILGLSRYEQSEIFHHEWDIVVYDIRKMMRLLLKSNPNVLGLLWLDKVYYIKKSPAGELLIENRHMFMTKKMYHSFAGYANSQLVKMERHAFKGYMGEKRKALVEELGYDTKSAAHLVRLLTMAIEALTEGELYVNRGNRDAAKLISIKKGEWPLDRVKKEADELFKQARDAYIHSRLPDAPDEQSAQHLLMRIMERTMANRLDGKRLA